MTRSGGLEESLNLGQHAVRVIEPREMPCIGNANEANVRIARRDVLAQRRRTECITLSPEQRGRNLECLPAITQEQVCAESAQIGEAMQQTEHGVEIAP